MFIQAKGCNVRVAALSYITIQHWLLYLPHATGTVLEVASLSLTREAQRTRIHLVFD